MNIADLQNKMEGLFSVYSVVSMWLCYICVMSFYFKAILSQ